VAKNRAKPPISSHGLFPVVVAIWFAALFGLGSLVLPTVLLERLATGSGIAALVPAAAPPLGVTARIAISSGAAVFGALIGFVIARRVAEAQALARPANLDRRLRFAEDDTKNRTQNGARRPISASEELGNARVDAPAEQRNAEPAPPPIPGRRRALAMQEEPGPSQFFQQAPLPGDDKPWADEHPLMPSATVIAEKQMALHGHAPEQQAGHPAQPVPASTPEPEPEPLDLQEYTEPPPENFEALATLRNRASDSATESQQDEAPARPAHPAFASPETSYAEIAPAPQARPGASASEAPAEFTPQPAEQPAPSPDFSQPAPFAAPVEEQPAPQQVAQPAQHLANTPQPEFDQGAGEVDLPFTSPAAPAQTSASALHPRSDPLAAFRIPSFNDEDEDEDTAMPFAAPINAAAEPSPVADDEPLPFVAPSQVKRASAASQPEPQASSVAEPLRALLAGESAPADTVNLPLEQLGMVELAERLGRSMHRRMAARIAAAPNVSPVNAAPAGPRWGPAGQPLDNPEAVQSAPGQARAFDMPATGAAPPPPVIPDALRPLSLELGEFGEDEDDDDDFAASFSMPLALSPAAPASGFAKPAEASNEPEPGEEDEERVDSEDAPSTAYSSLLAMKSPFRGPAEFVRIEVPEPEAGAIEPAVVFPGQRSIPPSSPPQFAEPAAAANAPGAEDGQADTGKPAIGTSPRRFDAPADADARTTQRKVRARPDPAETERALRSALATLQRMSGAA